MPDRQPPVARLRGFLEGADIPSGTLRRDPEGATWLPAELRALVLADPRCRQELRRFVDRELELFGSVRQTSDALFTARVLRASAPVQIAGAGLASRQRGLILAFAYALATGVAYLMLAPLLGLAALGTWADRLDRLTRPFMAAGVEDGGGAIGVPAALVIVIIGVTALVLAVAFMPSRRHTTPPA